MHLLIRLIVHLIRALMKSSPPAEVPKLVARQVRGKVISWDAARGAGIVEASRVSSWCCARR